MKPRDALLSLAELGAEKLDGANFVEENVSGLVDLGHSAFSEELQDHVLAQPLPEEGVRSGVESVFVHDDVLTA
jgi:hypothetical protein